LYVAAIWDTVLGETAGLFASVCAADTACNRLNADAAGYVDASKPFVRKCRRCKTWEVCFADHYIDGFKTQRAALEYALFRREDVPSEKNIS
jgi:hypothetical protein